MLDDKKIRAGLKEFITKRSIRPKQLVEELRVHEGNCIADLVAIYTHMHAFEIKGQTDNISRIKIQSTFYNKSFPYITLVTTENHFSWAVRESDPFWGVIIATEKNSEIAFKYARAASTNPYFDVRSALQMLWRDELISLHQSFNKALKNKRATREQIADEIFPLLNKKTGSSAVAKLINRRALNRVGDKSHMRS